MFQIRQSGRTWTVEAVAGSGLEEALVKALLGGDVVLTFEDENVSADRSGGAGQVRIARLDSGQGWTVVHPGVPAQGVSGGRISAATDGRITLSGSQA